MAAAIIVPSGDTGLRAEIDTAIEHLHFAGNRLRFAVRHRLPEPPHRSAFLHSCEHDLLFVGYKRCCAEVDHGLVLDDNRRSRTCREKHQCDGIPAEQRQSPLAVGRQVERLTISEANGRRAVGIAKVDGPALAASVAELRQHHRLAVTGDSIDLGGIEPGKLPLGRSLPGRRP